MIRIGTRGSKLALAQTRKVITALKSAGIDAKEVIITTKGDKVTDRGLHKIGSYGVFVRELDNAILSGEIDAAVHSMKDIPVERPAGIVTAAVLPRDSPNDFMVTYKPLGEIKTVGTSSLRRKAQILRYFKVSPDIVVKELRGNIDTRISKLQMNEYDAIVLAEAGLQRLNLELPGYRLPISSFIPSPNQGTIAVVCRNNPELKEIFKPLNNPDTEQDTRIERILIEEIGGGCFLPMGIYCLNGNLTAEILSPNGTETLKIQESNLTEEKAHIIGKSLKEKAEKLIHEAELLRENVE